MARVITCPSCQRKLQVPEDLAGQEVQCPACDKTFFADAGGPASLPPASALPRETGPPPLQRRGRHWADEEDDDYGEREFRRRGRRDYQPHRGSLILVLGILSLVLGGFGLIIGPFAWIMGNADLQAMREGRMDSEGEGLTTAGRVCGIIASILGLIILGFCCLWFTFAVGVAGMGGKGGF